MCLCAVMSSCSFILVNPQLAANVGACARAVANFGFSDLRIVSHADHFTRDEDAIAISCHGSNVLGSAKIFNSVKDSICDLHYIYAVSARERDLNKPCFSPKNVKLFQKIGFMFGCESSGLSNEDVSFSDALLKIDTDNACSSLNISHAVCLIAYELHEKCSTMNIEQKFFKKDCNIAERNSIHMMLDELEFVLDKSGFFRVPGKKRKMMMNLRSTVFRALLSDQEVKTLRGIIKSCKLMASSKKISI